MDFGGMRCTGDASNERGNSAKKHQLSDFNQRAANGDDETITERHTGSSNDRCADCNRCPGGWGELCCKCTAHADE